MTSGLLLLASACASGASSPKAAEASPASGSERSTEAPAPARAADPALTPDPALIAVLAMEHRRPEDRARDGARHPAETLTFFGLRPDSTVVEIWPGSGWYTDILAPYLRGKGRLILATMDPWDPTQRGDFTRKLSERLAKRPDLYDKVESAILFYPDEMNVAPPESVDLVLLVRELHNWIRWKGQSPKAYFTTIATVLKPDGVLGIVQHRGTPTTPKVDTGESGYLTEALVIRLAAEAGLELDARSEINGNPKDHHDHPDGVWSLPPSFKSGAKNRDVFLAIGESDRMTLRFRKKAAAPRR